MDKNTYYFSHDYDSRSDMKIKKLIAKHGYLGYGLFWAIVEDLYMNANAMQTDYDLIAFDLRSDTDTIKSIINDFDLFVIEDDCFGSTSIQSRLEQRNEKSEKARQSAFARWNKEKKNTNAMRTHNECNAIKERKGKDNKVKESKEDIKKSVFNFYNFEIEKAENSEDINLKRYLPSYRRFVKYLFDEIDLCMPMFSIPKQLSYEQFGKLKQKEKETGIKFKDKFQIFINNENYIKKKKSVYLTLNNFMNNNFK